MSDDWSDEYLIMIHDCELRESRLTNWECQFLDSLRHQIERDFRPTEKQLNMLDKLWRQATAHG